MRQTAAVRTATSGSLRPAAIGLVVVTAAIVGSLIYQAASSSVLDVSLRDHDLAAEAGGAVTEDDGALPDGVTAFDDRYAGIANLDPDLLHAIRDAATDAGDDGIEIYVKSGWRSLEYQNQLFREAVAEYGSEEEAARWVATADTSAHVSGDAIDIGPFVATAWLSEHGAAYGLCQTYGNEPWHYELRPQAIDHGCPRTHPGVPQPPGMDE